MNPYSIIMFCFAAALLLYAADLAITKNYNLVARNWAAKPKDEKAYTVHLAKIIALVALAPAVFPTSTPPMMTASPPAMSSSPLLPDV